MDAADMEAGWHTLYTEKALLPKPSLRLLTAHAIFSFVASPGEMWAEQVVHIAPVADLHLLSPRPPEHFDGHASDYLLQQLSSQYAFQEGVRQMLSSLRERGLGGGAKPGGPIVIHPGSGSPAKCWPLEKFIELGHALLAAGKRVKFLLGEVEQERMAARAVKELSSAFEVHQPQTYLQLWDHLREAGGFVGNDSGPGHLAGVMGLPTVSLFGPTCSKTWRPIGPRVTVIDGKPLAELSAAEVLESADSF